MNVSLRSIIAALLVAAIPAAAQQLAAAPAASATAPAAKSFSQQQLDELLAPIALYPDALLTQVLMASTYPLEIVEAARWSKANPGLKDKALEEAMQKQKWDPSVKSLTSVPQVLSTMNEKLEWTQKLGDAFLAQQADVLQTAQSLRAKAQAAGNLKSTPEQSVKQEQQEGKTVYIIESAKPEVVYVPTYSPAVVYGPWWYSYPPPYYMYPPAYVYPRGVAFATGVVVGAAIWGGANWGRNEVNINVNRYNNFNKTNIQNTNFQHNAEHRKGVAYKDNATAQRYNRGADAKAVQSREQFRGQAEQGRNQLQGMDRSQMQNRAQQTNRTAAGSAGSRDMSSRTGAGASTRSSGGQGGFSGAGSGASTRAASQRGGASRASAGGGGGGGRRR